MNEKKKKIINTIIFIIILFGISSGLFYLLKYLGVNDQESLQIVIKKTKAWGPIVFFLLQVSITTLLSVIPGTSFMFIALAGILFENVWLAIFLALIGVWTSSILMFFIGDTLGEKVASKLVGKESLQKAQDLIDTKTKIYLPLMFLFPFFPDDALCLAAGMTKLKYSYFIPVVLIFRSTGVLAVILTTINHKSIFEVLGLNSLSPIQWILLVNVLIFDVFVIFKITNKIEEMINKKKEKNSSLKENN